MNFWLPEKGVVENFIWVFVEI